MTKRILYVIFLILFLSDVGYSFLQHFHQPLDGDMAWNIVPSDDVKPVLANPFGINALYGNQTYANPNRFFSHWMQREYFLSVPLLLQKFAEPIDSIYLSCAIAKILIQLLIIILLAMAIAGTRNVLKLDFIIAAVIISPLFQTNGYRTYMGIIDPSTTYTFFYALPCAILMLYLLPFIFRFYYGEKTRERPLFKFIWIALAIVVCLSGPLNPGIVLIFSLLVIVNRYAIKYSNSDQKGMDRITDSYKKIPKAYGFYLLPVCIFAAYSLFLGRYNSITVSTWIPLTQMYERIPVGIYYEITQKLGFPLLFLMLIINSVIIHKKYKTVEGQKILNVFKWIGIFSVCYILLLPLGGYRPYRYNVLRYDTIMPVTLCLMFVFGSTSLFLLKSLSKKQKIWYLPLLTCILVLFMISDAPDFNNNKCERLALKEIAASKDSIVKLHNDCSVVSWGKILKPEESKLNAQLLTLWKVTKENKLYYNESLSDH